MTATIGASSSTFSAVLDKLFKDEPLASAATNMDFSRGVLCPVCRYFVRTLDRLEKEMIDVKNLIFSLFKNECIEVNNDENVEKESEIQRTNVEETQKKCNSVDRSKNSSKVNENVNESGKKTKSKEPPEKDKESNQAFESKRITRQCLKLNGYELKEKEAPAPKDKLIEALLDKRGYKYLVKWKNYPEVSNSWEPRFILPQFIVKVEGLFIFIK